jgi:DNA-binding transcriptional LysR family regulator
MKDWSMVHMTLRHLKIFITVCEQGSITAAANKLYIAQPSISLAISELESYYGVKLFDRISRKLLITEAGKHLLFDEMESSMKDWNNIGVLRVGSSISIGGCLIPKYVKQFSEICPQTKVQVIIDNSAAIEKRILSGDIDFGLIEGVVHKESIISENFLDDELVLICGRNHPLFDCEEISLGELMKNDFILREKGSGTRELFDSTMLINNVAVTPIWESISTHAIVQAVAEGLGLSVLPYRLVQTGLENQKIKSIKIKDISFKRKFFIIYHHNKYLNKAAKQFIDMCKNYAE